MTLVSPLIVNTCCSKEMTPGLQLQQKATRQVLGHYACTKTGFIEHILSDEPFMYGLAWSRPVPNCLTVSCILWHTGQAKITFLARDQTSQPHRKLLDFFWETSKIWFQATTLALFHEEFNPKPINLYQKLLFRVFSYCFRELKLTNSESRRIYNWKVLHLQTFVICNSLLNPIILKRFCFIIILSVSHFRL